MSSWFIFSILALILWGLSDFFPKLSIGYISPKSFIVYSAVGVILVNVGIFIFWTGLRPEFNVKGVIFAVLTGLLGSLGYLFFALALAKGGKLSVVVPLAALYPVLTITLAFSILRESITLQQGIGIILALAAMILFTR